MQQTGCVTLRLLGRFALRAEGEPARLIRITSRKGCGLIARLAMHGAEGESREALATLLWGNQHDRQARQNLRQCLTSLRSDLALAAPGLLLFEGEMLRLDFSRLGVDALDFLALAESSAADDLVRAAALYRGEFLAGIGFDVEPFDEWVRMERARIAAAAARAFEFCVGHFERLADGARVVEAAERLGALDPLREDWQRLLLRAYARYRGSDVALAHAHTVAALIKRELAVEPESATAELIAAIRSGAIAPVAAGPAAARESPPPEPVPTQDMNAVPVVTPPRARAGLLDWARGVSRKKLAVAAAGAAALLVGALGLVYQATLAGRSGVSWMPPRLPADLAGDMAALKAKAIVPIMVWPFEAPDGGSDRKLADAVTDDLTTNLARNDGLRVISHQTSSYYRTHAADPAGVGAAFGVNYVVEGSVRTRNDRVHVNVRLVDPTTRLQVWADAVERDNADSLKVQNEIARRLARELRLAAMISSVPHHHKNKREPVISELVAKARAAQFRGPGKGDIAASLGYFEQALQRDPKLMPALVGIASELTMGSLNYLLDRKPSLARAEKLLHKALGINPRSVSANYWMGMVEKAQGRYESAVKSFQHAIAIEPSFAPAYAQTGIALTLLGRSDDAMPYIEYAMRLSPKDPIMRFWTMFAGATELERGNDKAALQWFEKSAAFTPQSPSLQMYFAGAYALAGDQAAAARYAAAFRSGANSAAAADLLRQIRLGADGKLAKLPRLRAGLERAFGGEL